MTFSRSTGLFSFIVLLAFGPAAYSARVRADDAPTAAAEPGSCTHHEPLAAAEPVPSTSLYQLKAKLTDQHGTLLGLDAFRGQPLLITMFYSSCTSICPALIAELQRAESLLPAESRAKLRVLLVSLDPARDSVARLAELTKLHGLDGPAGTHWHFTRTSPGSVREIAALLGVRYRLLPDGSIGHSALVALLDQNGVLVTRFEGTAVDPNKLAAAVTDVAKKAAH